MADAVPVMDMEGNRFAALGVHDAGSAAQGAPSAETVRQRRHLVLVFDPPAEGEVGGQESEADTESLPGAASEVETVEVPKHTVDSDPIPMERRLRAAPGAFASLDAIDLRQVFELRARVMRSVPVVLRGAFRAAIRVSMQEILNGVEAHSEVRAERGWKLLMLLPKLLLFRPAWAAWFPGRSWKVALDNSKKGIGSLS